MKTLAMALAIFSGRVTTADYTFYDENGTGYSQKVPYTPQHFKAIFDRDGTFTLALDGKPYWSGDYASGCSGCYLGEYDDGGGDGWQSTIVVFNGVPKSFGGDYEQFNGGSDGSYAQLTYGFAPGVPEASTWGMMLLGLGAVGLSLRRRATVDRPA